MNDMTVPGNQVKNFMDTLKGYSDKCGEARTVVERAVQQGKAVEKEAEKKNSKMLSDMKRIKREIDAVSKQQTEALEAVKKDMEAIQQSVEQVTADKRSVSRCAERMEVKESFVCSFADVCKESERMTRRLYTRTL